MAVSNMAQVWWVISSEAALLPSSKRTGVFFVQLVAKTGFYFYILHTATSLGRCWSSSRASRSRTMFEEVIQPDF